jgi:hypothetical protein
MFFSSPSEIWVGVSKDFPIFKNKFLYFFCELKYVDFLTMIISWFLEEKRKGSFSIRFWRFITELEIYARLISTSIN